MATMARKQPKTVQEYIAASPKAVQPRLKAMRRTVRQAAPGAREALGYGMPSYAFDRNRVWFAAFDRHIGFYPGSAAVAAFKDELADYKSAKGSVQFPHDEPLPLGLVSRIVKQRLKPKPPKR